MPIKGMRDVYRPKKIGRIGLGIKVPVEDEHGEVRMKDGKEVTHPQATDYFVVPEEVAALPEIGPKPRQLPIYFLMDRDEEVLPHNLMLYSGRGLMCMGDGERVLWRRHGTGKDSEVLIYGGVANWDKLDRNGILEQWETEKGYGTATRVGNTVKCLYRDCPRHKPTMCRPTGMLRFGIQGIVRQGFWQLTVHLNPMVQLLSQLRHGREFVEQYCGRPTIMHADWLLTLTGPVKMQVGKFWPEVYTPELELDPEWMQRAMEGRVRLPVIHRLTTEEIYGAPEEPPAMDNDMLEELPYDPTESEEVEF